MRFNSFESHRERSNDAAAQIRQRRIDDRTIVEQRRVCENRASPRVGMFLPLAALIVERPPSRRALTPVAPCLREASRPDLALAIRPLDALTRARDRIAQTRAAAEADIALIERRLAELRGVRSAAARAKLRRLRASVVKARAARAVSVARESEPDRNQDRIERQREREREREREGADFSR